MCITVFNEVGVGGSIPALLKLGDFSKTRWCNLISKMCKLKYLSVFIHLFIQQTFLTTCCVFQVLCVRGGGHGEDMTPG